MWRRWMERRCRRGSSSLGRREEMVLTVPAVEFGEAGRVTAGQLGGAPEGRRRQTGNQRGVAHLCRPKKEERLKTVKNGPLASNKCNKPQTLSFIQANHLAVAIYCHHGDRDPTQEAAFLTIIGKSTQEHNPASIRGAERRKNNPA